MLAVVGVTAEAALIQDDFMQVVSHPSPAAFLQATADFRDHNRHWTNAISTQAESRAAGRMATEHDALWLQVLDDRGRNCGVAMLTPPRGLLVSAMPAQAAEAVAAYVLAEGKRARGIQFPTVDGPAEPATAVAKAITAHAGRIPELGLSQRLLGTAVITAPSGVAGHMRPAAPADLDLVNVWLAAFSAEAVPDQPPNPNQREMLRRRLEAKPPAIWIWDVDGTSMSLCWRSLPAAGVVRISAVYTPPEHRGHGYASANVAALSQLALSDDADLVMLYTDSTKPTSNKIYEALGYRYVGDAIEWLLA